MDVGVKIGSGCDPPLFSLLAARLERVAMVLVHVSLPVLWELCIMGWLNKLDHGEEWRVWRGLKGMHTIVILDGTFSV